MPSARERRNVYLFGATSFLNDTASEMAYWILPAFLRGIGAGPAQLGIIEGIAESVAAGMQLISERLADRFSRRKPLVVAGYAVANFAKPFLALTSQWWQVLLIRFADRSSKGLRSAPRDVLLSESEEHAKLGAAFGILQTLDSAGAIVGPLIALLILGGFTASVSASTDSMRTVFWAAAVPGVLAVGFSLLAHETRTTAKAISTSTPTLASSAQTSLDRSFYMLMFTVTVFSLGGSSDMFLVMRAQEVGIPVARAPLLGLVFNAVYAAAASPAGHLSDRIPKR